MNFLWLVYLGESMECIHECACVLETEIGAIAASCLLDCYELPHF